MYVAVRYPLAGLADQCLLEHTHAGQSRDRAVGTNGRGNFAGRVSVGPPSSRHGDKLGTRKDSLRSAVAAGIGHGLQHQVDRLQSVLKILLSPAGCADADEYGTMVRRWQWSRFSILTWRLSMPLQVLWHRRQHAFRRVCARSRRPEPRLHQECADAHGQ